MKGFIWNCFGVLFARYGATLTEKKERHEMTHCYQIIELGCIAAILLSVIIPLCTTGGWWWFLELSAPFAFYLWYGVEWGYQEIWSWFDGTIDSYKMTTFEQEAYANDDNKNYNKGRAPFAFLRYWNSRVIYD